MPSKSTKNKIALLKHQVSFLKGALEGSINKDIGEKEDVKGEEVDGQGLRELKKKMDSIIQNQDKKDDFMLILMDDVKTLTETMQTLLNVNLRLERRLSCLSSAEEKPNATFSIMEPEEMEPKEIEDDLNRMFHALNMTMTQRTDSCHSEDNDDLSSGESEVSDQYYYDQESDEEGDVPSDWDSSSSSSVGSAFVP